MLIDFYFSKNIIFKFYLKLTINIVKYKFLIMNINIFIKNTVNFINIDIFNCITCIWTFITFYATITKSVSYFHLSRNI